VSGQNEFASLLTGLHEKATPQDILDRVVKTALQVMGCDGAACALWRDHGGLQLGAFTDAAAKRAGMLQLELEDGPCLTAVRVGGHVRVDRTTTDKRWPEWAAVVLELGVCSSISVALTSGDPRSVGSLFVYSHRANAFDDEDVATVQILAAHAAIAVRQVRHDAALERAIDTRTVIGQAQGIVMNRYHVTANQAFAALTRCSQASNVKLRDVAATVVRDGDLPRVDPGPNDGDDPLID